MTDNPENTSEPIVDEGMRELEALEGELQQEEGAKVHSQSQQREEELKSKVDPYDRQIATLAAGAAIGLGGYIAKRRGDHWNFAEDEAENFGIAVAKTVEHYFPEASYPPYLELMIVSGMMVGSRLALDAMYAKAANDEPGQTDNKKGGDDGEG